MKIINPFVLSDGAEAGVMRKNLLGSMGSERLEVVLKRQNTSRFFAALDERAKLAALRGRLAEQGRAREAATVAAAKAGPGSPSET